MSEAVWPRRSPPAKCRACARPLNTPLVCDSCHALNPAPGVDYFALFAMTPGYDLEPAELRQRYLQLAREVHPDRQAQDTPDSQEASAQLNEAFRVLSDPVLRAEYLLELAGGHSATDDRRVDPTVLDATVAMREDICDAHATNDQAAIAVCRQQVEKRRSGGLARVGELARRLPGAPEERAALRSELNALKYYDKLRREL